MTIAAKKKAGSADSLSTHSGFSLISDEKLIEIYSTMLRCRMIEKQIGAAAPIAAVAGVAIDLLPSDTLAPSQGALIPCYVKGLSLAALLSIHAGVTPAPRPNYAALGLVPPSFTFARQLERSLLTAAADRSKKSKRIAVIFCGGGTAGSSELATAMKQAGKKKLPMLFVRESGIEEEDAEAWTRKFGFPAITVDGDDAVAVYRVATESIAHARRGNGPTLIDCKTWPHGKGKRSGRGSGSDPIGNMEAYLTRKGLFSKKLKSSIVANFRRELAAV
jgi:TPP-dependent pyruvate/acetoin dehydrogenase alpha subunit